MRWIRRLFLILCLALTGLIIWAGVYARKQGFTASWRAAIEREFEQRGYYVEIGKITLGAFRGLVAENIRFYHDPEKSFELAFVDDVYLDVDLSRILSKEISVNTLDVADASLSLPLDPLNPHGSKLKVESLSGRLVITESMIEVVSAEASIADIDVKLSGTLLRPPLDDESLTDEDRQVNSEELAARRFQISRIIEELEKFEFLEGSPSVTVEFRGDLDDFSTMTARAWLEASRFKRKGDEYGVEGLSGLLRFDGNAHEAEIEELLIRDQSGEISLIGQWNQDTNRIDFEMQSDADISSLLGFFWKDRKLGEVVFFNPPEIQMKGHLDLNELGKDTWRFPGSVIGQFHSEKFVTRGTVFSGLDFGFSAEGERFYVRNLRLDHKSGVAFANFKYEPDAGEQSIQYHCEFKLDPHSFRPFFDENGREFLDAWEFTDSSVVYLAAVGEGSNWDLSTWTNKGVLDLRNFYLSGVEFEEMEADFESEDGILMFREILMGREEGSIVAEMARFDPAIQQWDVKGVVSTVDLIQGTKAFNAQLSEEMEKYQFQSPPRITLAGLLDARMDDEVGDAPRNNELSITFSSDDAASYEFLGKSLELTAPSGRLEISGSRVHLTDFSAGVLSGAIELDYDALDVRSESGPFDASITVKRIPLEAVTRHYGNTEVATGRVDAVFHLSGDGRDVSTLNGYGAASIEEGELFALPLLGALAGVVQASGSDGGVAKEAQMTLKIENGVVSTDDFVALTDGMYVRGAGTVSLVDHSVDLEAVVNTRGVLSRTILTPVSELLTFSCSGTVQEPEWKAKHISNFGKLPTQVLTEMTSVPFEGLKALGEGLFKFSSGAPTDSPEAGGSFPSAQGMGDGLRTGEGLRMLGQGLFGNQADRHGNGEAPERQGILPIFQGRKSQGEGE